MTRMTTLALTSLLVANAGLASCASPKGPGPEQPKSAADDKIQTKGSGDCEHEQCGSNTAIVNGYHIDELHLATGQKFGQKNHNDVRISKFLPPPEYSEDLEFTLYALGGRLFARSGDGSQILAGTQLEGAQIILEHAPESQETAPEVIPIVIYRYAEVGDWGLAPNKVTLPRYLVTYDPDRDTIDRNTWREEARTPICDTAAALGTVEVPQVSQRAWVTVLTDLRYEHDANGRVLASIHEHEQPGWFNLACIGHGLFKTKHLGYEIDPDPAHEQYFSGRQTPDKHQATIKAITADYCGDNRSFTEDGTPLRWVNRAATVDNRSAHPSDVHFELEALWNEKGAMCLTSTRTSTRKDQLPPCAASLPQCPDPATLPGWEWATYKVNYGGLVDQ